MKDAFVSQNIRTIQVHVYTSCAFLAGELALSVLAACAYFPARYVLTRFCCSKCCHVIINTSFFRSWGWRWTAFTPKYMRCPARIDTELQLLSKIPAEAVFACMHASFDVNINVAFCRHMGQFQSQETRSMQIPVAANTQNTVSGYVCFRLLHQHGVLCGVRTKWRRAVPQIQLPEIHFY